MKTTVTTEKKNEEITFPVLMKDKALGQIVMFLDEENGVSLTPVSGCPAGEYHTYVRCTDEDVWGKLEGTVTLQND